MTVVTLENPTTEYVFYGNCHTSDAAYDEVQRLLDEHGPDAIGIEVQKLLPLEYAAQADPCAAALQDADTTETDVYLIDEQPEIPPEAVITSDVKEVLGLGPDTTVELAYDDAQALRTETAEKAPAFFELYAEYREERMTTNLLEHVLFEADYETVLVILGTAHLPALYNNLEYLTYQPSQQ